MSFFEINNHFDKIKLNALAGALVVTFMWIFNGPVEHEPSTQQITDGQTEMVTQAGEYQNHYNLVSEIDAPFLITAIYPQRRKHVAQDFHSEFVTFTPAATRKYMKKYAGMTHCPASFLNRHAEHISLYAANADIAKTLSRWKQKEGSQVSRWEIVNIKGKCIGKRTKIEQNGVDITDNIRIVTLGRKASRACHKIYVTEIERTDATPQDYMEG